MKAVIYTRDRGLAASEIPLPEMDDESVLVKIADTGFCGSDHSLVKSGGLADGTVLGHEVSGTVVETGGRVKGVETGRRVIIRPTYCGRCRDCLMGKEQFCQNDRRHIGLGDLSGGFAEYIKVFPQMLITVPEGVDSRNAALAEVFASSLHGINCLSRPGGSALVMGGGPIGLVMVMLLKLKGFGPVALSEPVPEKRELGLSLGADHAFDPLTENLGARVYETTAGVGFENIFECSGIPTNVQAGLDAAARGGAVCIVSMIGSEIGVSPLSLNFKEVILTGSYGNTHGENKQCLEWMRAGRLDGGPLITDLITLDELPAVYRDRIDTGRAVKVMIRIGEEF